jgi:4-amino-4-deoxy-L-arabinose transferase-like glycosyltransferase
VRVPRVALLLLWAVLTAVTYFLVLFTNFGNPYHGGTYFGTVVTETVGVLATFAGLEIIRTEKIVPLRAIAGAVGVPLVLVILLTFWYGVRRYVTG